VRLTKNPAQEFSIVFIPFLNLLSLLFHQLNSSISETIHTNTGGIIDFFGRDIGFHRQEQKQRCVWDVDVVGYVHWQGHSHEDRLALLIVGSLDFHS